MTAARPVPAEAGDDGIGTGRGYDRFVNFSDAVVAIAITLLGLPLVDIRPPAGDQSAWDVINEHGGEVYAFAFTFLVVAMLWSAHNRVFGRIRGYDKTLLWLNLAYLFAIVLLPFPSEWAGEQGFEHGIGTFYLGTLTFASGSLGLCALYARRHPDLLEPAALAGGRHPLTMTRSLLFTVFFFVMAVLALPWPGLTSYLMFLLFPLSFLQQRLDRRSTRRAARPEQPARD